MLVYRGILRLSFPLHQRIHQQRSLLTRGPQEAELRSVALDACEQIVSATGNAVSALDLGTTCGAVARKQAHDSLRAIIHRTLCSIDADRVYPKLRQFSVFANCYRPDLAHPARCAFLAGNDYAERPLAGWQRLAVLGVRQEDDSVGEFRVNLSQ